MWYSGLREAPRAIAPQEEDSVAKSNARRPIWQWSLQVPGRDSGVPIARVTVRSWESLPWERIRFWCRLYLVGYMSFYGTRFGLEAIVWLATWSARQSLLE